MGGAVSKRPCWAITHPGFRRLGDFLPRLAAGRVPPARRPLPHNRFGTHDLSLRFTTWVLMEETMPEHVTGSDLRARADGLKTVIEGDANTFNREALVGIVNDIRGALQAAANTLEAHELHRR